MVFKLSNSLMFKHLLADPTGHVRALVPHRVVKRQAALMPEPLPTSVTLNVEALPRVVNVLVPIAIDPRRVPSLAEPTPVRLHTPVPVHVRLKDGPFHVFAALLAHLHVPDDAPLLPRHATFRVEAGLESAAVHFQRLVREELVQQRLERVV